MRRPMWNAFPLPCVSNRYQALASHSRIGLKSVSQECWTVIRVRTGIVFCFLSVLAGGEDPIPRLVPGQQGDMG